MTGSTDSLRGDVLIESDAQRGQVQVAVDAVELVACFDHSGGTPAQRHGEGPEVHILAQVLAHETVRRSYVCQAA